MDPHLGSRSGRRALVLNAVVAVGAAVLAVRMYGPVRLDALTWQTLVLAYALLCAAWVMDATRVHWGSDRAGRAQTASATNAVLLPAAVLLPPALFLPLGLATSAVYLSTERGWVGAVGNAVNRTAQLSAAAVMFAVLAPGPTLDPNDLRSVESVVGAGLVMIATEAIMVVHMLRAVDGLDAKDLPLLAWRDMAPELPEVLLGAILCVLYPTPSTWLVMGLILWSHVAIRQRAILRSASRDPKTGLLSWPAFEQLAAAELDRSRRTGSSLAMLLMDLDGLKAVNTAHGHLAGDQFIVAMAQLLSDGTRSYDLVGRFGGDEFCVLLPDTTRDQASIVAERIRRTTRATRIPGVGSPMSVSIGVAVPNDSDDVRSLARAADQAMRQAKTSRRNLVVVASEAAVVPLPRPSAR